MAHYAELNEINEVIYVIYMDNEIITDENGNEVEELGIQHLHTHHGSDRRWVRTSYNNNFRMRYAGIGYSYNEELDAFIPPKPFESWVLNIETKDWESPIGEPPELTQQEINSDSYYQWNEESYQSDNTSGWILITPETSTEEEPPVE
jgi:hypothetical protein